METESDVYVIKIIQGHRKYYLSNLTRSHAGLHLTQYTAVDYPTSASVYHSFEVAMDDSNYLQRYFNGRTSCEDWKVEIVHPETELELEEIHFESELSNTWCLDLSL